MRRSLRVKVATVCSPSSTATTVRSRACWRRVGNERTPDQCPTPCTRVSSSAAACSTSRTRSISPGPTLRATREMRAVTDLCAVDGAHAEHGRQLVGEQTPRLTLIVRAIDLARTSAEVQAERVAAVMTERVTQDRQVRALARESLRQGLPRLGRVRRAIDAALAFGHAAEVVAGEG